MSRLLALLPHADSPLLFELAATPIEEIEAYDRVFLSGQVVIDTLGNALLELAENRER